MKLLKISQPMSIGLLLFLLLMAAVAGFCFGMVVADFTDWELWGRKYR